MADRVERVSIGLVACAKDKAPDARPARSLYRSPLFRRASEYAARTYDHWFVLSAQHYLLHPDEVIEPYDKTLARMPKWEREHWASMVEAGLRLGGNFATEGRVNWPARPAPELRLGEWIMAAPRGVQRRVDLWFHAGADYTGPVRALLAGWGRELPYDVHLPLEHLMIGQQLAWYKRQAQPTLF